MNEDRIDQGLSTADIAGNRRLDETQEIPPRSGPGGAAVASDFKPEPLFPEREVTDMRSRWDAIQTGFVDEPRKSVEEADHLVASAIQRLAQVFADERTKLEGQWDRGDNISTEDLRVALQRYRSFFTRLLSV